MGSCKKVGRVRAALSRLSKDNLSYLRSGCTRTLPENSRRKLEKESTNKKICCLYTIKLDASEVTSYEHMYVHTYGKITSDFFFFIIISFISFFFLYLFASFVFINISSFLHWTLFLANSLTANSNI